MYPYDNNPMMMDPTGANRDGYGWRAQRRDDRQELGTAQDTLANAQARYGQMQERFKSGSSRRQQVMQPRMDQMQQRINRLSGQIYDPNAEGADRMGMGWRQDRRREKRQGATGAAPEPAQMAAGAAPPAAPSGYNPAAQAAPMGGYTDAFGNASTKEAYDARLAQWRGGNFALPMYGNFNTGFGQLTPGSGGNAGVFKQNNASDQSLYHFDPNAGWKHMTANEYQGYGDYNYANPNQSMNMFNQAGGMYTNRRGY